jgi:hypothetical protein
MARDVRSLPTDLQAAHVALLALGAALPAATSGSVAYLLPEDTEPRNVDVAARWLASLPKPLALGGSRADARVHLATEGALASTSPVIQSQLSFRQYAQDGQWLMELLARRFGSGADNLPVACAGAASVLLALARGVAQYEKDYVLSLPHGYGADYVDSHYPEVQGVGREELADAVALLRFGSGGHVVVVQQ